MKRGSGETSRQMKAAPVGSIYVWCNGSTSYPMLLARKLQREDLQIKPLSWLSGSGWRGLHETVVLDHAATPNSQQWEALNYLWRKRA